jgi:hypothetical protein
VAPLLPGLQVSGMELHEYDEHLKRTYAILPAWFVGRMSDDTWSFGLLLVTGHVIGISTINNIHQAADGSIWLDVEMLDDDAMFPSSSRMRHWPKPLTAPTSRLTASINAAHVVCAVELADT